jgi:cell division septation protein DedD
MVDHSDRRQDEKGLSARYLILVFLVGVAACAIFFSLGFLVGYNERTSKSPGPTEQVTPSGVIPPTVNAPLESIPTTGNETASISARERAPQRSLPDSAAEQKPAGDRAAAQAPPSPSPRTSTRATASSVPARSVPSREVEAGYTVQVAASRDKLDAEKLVKELKSRGFAVFVVRPEYSEAKDKLYRVQVGPFATREEAQKVRERIAKEGFKPFIKH